MAQWVRVDYKGTLPGGEVWSAGASFANPVDSQAAPQGYDSMVAILARAVASIRQGAAVTNLLTMLSLGGAVTQVRVEARSDAAGLVNVAQEALNPAVAGVGALSKPHQCSVVVSHLTGVPGRSFRGRTFWPALGGSLTSPTAVQTTPSPLQIAEAWRALVGGIEDRSGALPVHAVVHSSTRALNTPVSSWRVGDRLDVQTGRRDKLVEVYSSAAHPAP